MTDKGEIEVASLSFSEISAEMLFSSAQKWRNFGRSWNEAMNLKESRFARMLYSKCVQKILRSGV